MCNTDAATHELEEEILLSKQNRNLALMAACCQRQDFPLFS